MFFLVQRIFGKKKHFLAKPKNGRFAIILARTRSVVILAQGGITCGAIDELRKSSKTIDERVIINFPDKNVVIARFRDKTAYVWGLRYR